MPLPKVLTIRVERLDRDVDPFALVEDDAGAGQRGDDQPVPVGQDAIVAGGRVALFAHRQQHAALLGQQRLVGLIGRSGIAQPARQVPALHIAVAGDAIDLLEARREGAHQRGVDFRFAPGVITAVLGLGAGRDRGGEDIAHLHFAQQEGNGFVHALAAKLVAVELADVGAEIDHLRLVVEHLLESGLQPALVQRVAEETAADMVIDAAEQDAVQSRENELAELRACRCAGRRATALPEAADWGI